MKTALKLVAVAAVFGGLYALTRRGTAPALIGTATLDPLEILTGPAPSVDDAPLNVPVPLGDAIPNPGTVIPNFDTRCDDIGLNVFDPACLGKTWTYWYDGAEQALPVLAEIYASGRARKMTDLQKRQNLIDPARIAWAYDYRTVAPGVNV